MSHHHVVLILSAEILEIHHHVRASLLLLEVHQTVVQNAQYTRIVKAIKLALILNVKTHAQDHVVPRQYVMFSTIFQFVHVLKDTSAIHSQAVGRNPWKVSIKLILLYVTTFV